MPIDEHFDYVWQDVWSQINYTLPFGRKPLKVDIEKAGIEQTFDIQIKNATHWKCGSRDVPILPLNPAYTFCYLASTVELKSLFLTISIKM